MNKKIKYISVIISIFLFFTGCSFSSKSTTIIVEKTEHGKITANMYTESQITLTTTPEDGYFLLQDSLTVSRQRNWYTPQKIELTKISENEYFFELEKNEKEETAYYITAVFISEKENKDFPEIKEYSIKYSTKYSDIKNSTPRAQNGDKVTFEVNLYYSSYTIDSVIVTGEDETSYPVTFEGLNYNGNYLYSFSMPAQNVSVTASAKESNGKYKVNIMPLINGKITVNEESHKYGDNVKITITPDSGYKIKNNSLVVYKDRYVISPIYNTYPNYSFNMPSHDVNVYIEFEKE